MDFATALQIGASGLSSQRIRLNTIASNLANSHTTKTQEGGPYKRRDVILAADPVETPFEDILSEVDAGRMATVRVHDIIVDGRTPLTKYDPHHPDADADGYIKLPRINIMEEMTNMLSAVRSYEANVAGIKATKEMAVKALEIGR